MSLRSRSDISVGDQWGVPSQRRKAVQSWGKEEGLHQGTPWEPKGQRTDLDVSGEKYEFSTPSPSHSLCYLGFLPVSHTSGTLSPHDRSHCPDCSSPRLPWLTSLDPSSFRLNIPLNEPYLDNPI